MPAVAVTVYVPLAKGVATTLAPDVANEDGPDQVKVEAPSEVALRVIGVPEQTVVSEAVTDTEIAAATFIFTVANEEHPAAFVPETV